MSRHWLTVDNFFHQATGLRRHFDKNFADPRSASAKRFVWDYWHVPEQYTLLRTPAYHYFPAALYKRWHQHLVNWGREYLGCHDISPPWLSCYVDGCFQDLHADHPHGPWAFVFSLTPWSTRRFSGGETWILRPQLLNSWPDPSAGGFHEKRELMVNIPPRFNRLVVFDPRLPHAVAPVRGEPDLRRGRLVIHGWFVQPRPFWRGPLSAAAVTATINPGLAAISKRLHRWAVAGQVSLRLRIQAAGGVSKITLLTNTLSGPPGAAGAAIRSLRQGVAGWQFGRARGPSDLTLPIQFGL